MQHRILYLSVALLMLGLAASCSSRSSNPASDVNAPKSTPEEVEQPREPSHEQDDESALAANRELKSRITALRTVFRAGLAPGECIYVLAPFRESPKGLTEFMWVGVTAWNGHTIKGTLRREPLVLDEFHAGQTVEVSDDTVSAYVRKHSDGCLEKFDVDSEATEKPLIK
jgi:uncharacterized protein YegJ (DUF2314 family)